MMDRRSLPLSALRAFERAATHLHMGKAGEELGVTHGAVSHQVRLLESRLNVQLFSRAHNKLSLTPAGARLLQAVSDGLDRILEGTRYLDPENLQGPLTIGCTQTIATSWAAKHICEFNEHYPTITINIREIEPRQVSIPREIDVAICYGAPRDDERRSVPLSMPQLYPVCSPRLLQQGGSVTQPTDILGFTLIHDQQVPWTKWLKRYGLADRQPRRNIYFPNTSQALSAALLGYGVAIANTFETDEFIRSGQLVRLLDKPADEECGYYLLAPSAANETLKSRVFEEWIIRACLQQSPMNTANVHA